MPVLDKPSFLAKYQTLMENTGNVAFHRAEAAFIALVNAVFACAARIVDDPRLATKPGENEEIGGMGMVYYERSVLDVFAIAQEGSRFFSLTGRLFFNTLATPPSKLPTSSASLF